MNFQPPEQDDPRDDEQRLIDGLRAEFEADAAPMGFDLSRTKMPWCSEPWAEYQEEATGHRWGGWLARAMADALTPHPENPSPLRGEIDRAFDMATADLARPMRTVSPEYTMDCLRLYVQGLFRQYLAAPVPQSAGWVSDERAIELAEQCGAQQCGLSGEFLGFSSAEQLRAFLALAPGLAPHQPQPEPQEAAEPLAWLETHHDGRSRVFIPGAIHDQDAGWGCKREPLMTLTEVVATALAVHLVPKQSSAPQEASKPDPDMRAICEALGFDPTNHHNAAKCPYCRPPESKEASKAVPVADEREAIEHALHLESEVNTEMPPHLQRGLAMHLHRQEQERQNRAEQLTAEDWDTCKQACERARERIASANPSQPEQMPEPVAHRYWSVGHSSRWQLAGKEVPPDAESLFTADQMREFAQEATRQAMERAAKVCDEIENGAAPDGSHSSGLAWECADAIRALSNAPKGQP